MAVLYSAVFFRRFHKRILNFELYTPAAEYRLQELLEQFSRARIYRPMQFSIIENEIIENKPKTLVFNH